jgi:bacterioferritin-associated ferredoxin
LIVCHCHRVTEQRVLETLRNGARTRQDVERACGAGTGCGGCRQALDSIVEAAQSCDCGAADCPRSAEHRRVA